jgi:CRISPR-associated protein Csx10
VKVITYRIHLLDPILATSLEGDPNSANAFDYLPGSALRGALIKKYLRANNLTWAQFDANEATVQRLFFNGTTRYLNGYPVEENQRTLPVPQSWQREKGKDEEFFDHAVELPNDDETQWQGISNPFCLLFDPDEDNEDNRTPVRWIQPDRLISVHTARDRNYGRARTDSGAIFRHEALQAGQTFEAAILCDQDSDAALLLPLLNGEAKLGGSRSASYGRVCFESAQEKQTWREVDGSLQLDYEGKLIITLLSDALIRDANGQQVVDSAAMTTALSTALGSITLTLDVERTFLRGIPLGGFNRKWGLPLPQSLAVKMGSVFVYDAPTGGANALRLALERLEQSGIGERRAEGFGRVAINWQTAEKLKKNERSFTRPPAKAITQNGSLAIAQQMAGRMLRQRLDIALTAKANDLGKQVKGPKNSQLSRLRLIIHDALRQEPTAGRQRLNQYFDSLQDRQTTRKQFSRDRVAGKGLLEWMRERAADESSIKPIFDEARDTLPTIGANVSATLTAGMIYEYNLRLIDAVLARAAKERKGEN